MGKYMCINILRFSVNNNKKNQTKKNFLVDKLTIKNTYFLQVRLKKYVVMFPISFQK